MTITTRAQSMTDAAPHVLENRRVPLLLQGRGHGENQQRHEGGDIGSKDGQRAYARNPHHGGGRVAEHAARAAGIGCGDNGSKVADVDLAAKYVPRDRAADDRRRNVVEETRQHKHDHEQQQPARPVVRQQRRHLVRHGAFLEVTRQQSEAHQQQEQVREQRKFVTEMKAEAGQPCALLEAGEDQLVGGDGAKACKRDRQRVPVKQRDAEQGQREQDEIERNAEEEDWSGQCGLACLLRALNGYNGRATNAPPLLKA